MRSDQGIRGDQWRLPLLERIPIGRNRNALWILALAHIPFGKPASTFPGYALGGLALLLVLAASLTPASPASAQSEGRIRIIGHALLEVAPDYVLVHIGVSNKAPTPTAALDQNSAVARKLIDFIKKFGVDARDIQTGAVSLQPSYKSVRDPNGTMRQEPDGYAANNTVQVKLNDLSRLGELMRAALDQGATNINGVTFGITDQEKWDAEARLKAVEDAMSQARQLTEAAKVKLGKLVEIVHPPRLEVRAPEGLAVRARAVGGASVPIEAGTLQVDAAVEMTWLVEQ